MEIKDLIYIIGGMIAIVASHFRNQNKIELVENDLKNHKENHAKLEARVSQHEEKIDEKLNSLSEKMDDLKTLIIEKMK